MSDLRGELRGDGCAICGGELSRELLRIRQPDRFERHLGIGGEGFLRRWVECVDCGAATAVHQPKNLKKLERLAADYYEVDFQQSSIGTKYEKVMGLPPTASDNALRVERVVRLARRWEEAGRWPAAAERRVLDIGAGTGVFLARFLDHVERHRREGDLPWSGVAVEPDPIAAEHLRGLGLFTVEETVYTADAELGKFELCTLNKVVEHVPDPVALVTSTTAALSPGGVVYVEVPDKLTAFHRPSDDNGLGALHCHLYTVQALDRLCAAASLVPVQIGRHYEPSGKISLSVFAVTAVSAECLATSG